MITKNNIGEEAKSGLKEIINTLFIEDLIRINEENHKTIQNQITSVQKDVSSEVRLGISKVLESTEKIDEKGKKLFNQLDNNMDDTLDEVEKIIENSDINTNKTIKDSSVEIINEINSLKKLEEHYFDENTKYFKKIEEVIINETNKSIGKVQNDISNQTNNLILNIDKLNDNLDKKSTDIIECINTLEVKNLKEINLVKNELISIINDKCNFITTLINKEFEELKVKNAKREYIFYTIIIILIIIQSILLTSLILNK